MVASLSFVPNLEHVFLTYKIHKQINSFDIHFHPALRGFAEPCGDLLFYLFYYLYVDEDAFVEHFVCSGVQEREPRNHFITSSKLQRSFLHRRFYGSWCHLRGPEVRDCLLYYLLKSDVAVVFCKQYKTRWQNSRRWALLVHGAEIVRKLIWTVINLLFKYDTTHFKMVLLILNDSRFFRTLGATLCRRPTKDFREICLKLCLTSEEIARTNRRELKRFQSNEV